MMNDYRIFFCLWLIATWCTPAAALNIQKGIHGIPRGSSISNHDYLTQVHQSKHATYYADSNMLYRVANELVPTVIMDFTRANFSPFLSSSVHRISDKGHILNIRFLVRIFNI